MMIIIDESENCEKIRELLKNEIRAYNYDCFGKYVLKRFTLYIRDNSSTIIAGVSGFTIDKYKTARLEFFWVQTDFRRKGIGTRLLERLEEYLRSKESVTIQVSTMSFQGPTFYKKMGLHRLQLSLDGFAIKMRYF